jgi:hypothetical protein
VGDFAYRIDYILLLICFLLFVLSVVYKLDLSSRVALAVWVVGNLFMDQAHSFVMDISTSNKTFGASIWYVTWSTVDVLCLWFIYKIHSAYHLPASKLTRYIMFCFLSLCALQLMRYADRVVFETDLLLAVYKYVIVSINISVVPFAMLWLIKDMRADKKGMAI